MNLCSSILLAVVTFLANFPLAQSTVSYDKDYFESIPARFGMDWKPPARTYQAHLQFLPDRPKLCDGTGGLDVVEPTDSLPVALLVERGNCTFEQKAWVAASHPNVSFMIVYDHTPEKSLVSMRETSDAVEIKLGMLFISYEAGMGMLIVLTLSLEK